MATPQSALAQIQSVATDFSETYVLACKIYVRVPKSREQYKMVDQNYSIMSSSFDQNLYLTKSDVEYYSSVPIWVLSPNDYWGIVRKLTRNEDIEIDATTGVIMDPSKKPWLKVAIGHTGNLTVFKDIIQFLSISTVAYAQVSALHYKLYMNNIDNHIIHYEFQGNDVERKYINNLLTMVTSAHADVGDMAPSIPELMLHYFGNDEVVLFDYYDVLEVKTGIVVDQIFLLSPEDGYSKIRTITVTLKNNPTNIEKNKFKESNDLLSLFSQSLNGRYAVTIRSSGPWFYIHPKMIPALKEMITTYQAIRKNVAEQNGGNDVPRTCEGNVARAKYRLKYLAITDYDNVGMYSMAVQLLKIRQSLLDNCILSIGNDPINNTDVRLYCKLTKNILDMFKKKDQGISELYIFPVNVSGHIVDDAIRHVTDADNMEVYNKNLKHNKDDEVNTNGRPWFVLYNETKNSSVMAKALHASITHLINTADAAVHQA